MHYLTLCCIAKNENAYLREWLEFHVAAGVERFIIYDNESETPVSETLRAYLHPSFLTVIEISGSKQQLPAYQHCLDTYGAETRWMGFIDADELLVPKQVSDLKALLVDYEDYGGLGVNWVTFGSAGHIHPPGGLQAEHYTLRTPHEDFANTHIKSIVRPDRAVKPLTAHSFAFRDGFYCVDENTFPVYKAFAIHSVDKVQCNHYFYRSQRDYFRKMDRGRADTGERQPEHYFYRQLDTATTPDHAARPFLPKVRHLHRKDSPELLRSLAREPREVPFGNRVDRFRRLLSEGRRDDAREELAMMAALHPGEMSTWVLTASFYRLTGKPALARAALRRALTINYAPEALYELFALQRDNGHLKDAAKTAVFLRNFMRSHHGGRAELPPQVEQELTQVLEQRNNTP